MLTLCAGIYSAVLAMMHAGSEMMFHAAWVPDLPAELVLRDRFPSSLICLVAIWRRRQLTPRSGEVAHVPGR